MTKENQQSVRRVVVSVTAVILGAYAIKYLKTWKLL
jgi:hypothetical protein